MIVNPSPLTYAVTATMGAAAPLLASMPQGAALLPLAHAAAVEAPWWGPLLISSAGALAGPIVLWIVKTVLGGAVKSGAAALRAWAASIRAKAKGTPTKDDDAAAEVKAAAVEAAARQLEESGKTLPFHKGE